MIEHEYRPIAFGGLKASAGALVAVAALALELLDLPDASPLTSWTWRVLGVVAGATALALVAIEIHQAFLGPRLVYRADPDTGRVSRSVSHGAANLDGSRGFHCVVRLRGWRHRAQVYHAGTRTGMSLAVVRFDPEVGEVLALWRDGHAIESTVYVRVDDLLTALAVLSDAEVQLLLSSERSEPMAGLVFALIGRRMASYKTERDRAEWELGVSQAALAASESENQDLTARLDAVRTRSYSAPPRGMTAHQEECEVDDLAQVAIDERRLRDRAQDSDASPRRVGRVGRVVDKVIDVAARVAGAAGRVKGAAPDPPEAGGSPPRQQGRM